MDANQAARSRPSRNGEARIVDRLNGYYRRPAQAHLTRITPCMREGRRHCDRHQHGREDLQIWNNSFEFLRDLRSSRTWDDRHADCFLDLYAAANRFWLQSVKTGSLARAFLRSARPIRCRRIGDNCETAGSTRISSARIGISQLLFLLLAIVRE